MVALATVMRRSAACPACSDGFLVGDRACPDCARIAITGAPSIGKTTFANKLDTAARHTDDLAHLGWSESSEAAALWFDAPGPTVIEGVSVPRALRKWLAAHPEGRPCDLLLIITGKPFVDHTKGQASMSKGIDTVLAEIEPALVARGVRVVRLAVCS